MAQRTVGVLIEVGGMVNLGKDYKGVYPHSDDYVRLLSKAIERNNLRPSHSGNMNTSLF